MPLTLRDLLEFDVLKEAGAEVLAGHDRLDRTVRWVHSSEIFEIGPLLFGGELLLTTGLGLGGPDAGARRHYVRDLERRGLAGLALELGRTFAEVPPEVVDEARRLELPLIALHHVVPFIRIAQAANTAIVDDGSARLRLVDDANRVLTESLVSGGGIGGILAAAGVMAQCPLLVLSSPGALVAAHGVDDHREAWRLADVARLGAPISVQGQVWGRVLAGPGSPLPDDDLVALVERTAAVLALAVLLAGSPQGRQDQQASALLADLAEGPVPPEADLRMRSGAAGFHPRPGQFVVPVAVDGPHPGPALTLLERAARSLAGPRLAGRSGGGVLGLLAVTAGPDPVGVARAAVEDARSRIGAPEVTAALGPALPEDAGPHDLARGLRAAVAALRLTVAERGTGGPPVGTARRFTLELELLRHDPAELAALARSAIGPLMDWDAAHRSELVRTLEVLLRHGTSPTRAAAALHLGRQSLYQRIERIETLLGHPVDDPELHAALLVAACAHRLSLR